MRKQGHAHIRKICIFGFQNLYSQRIEHMQFMEQM